jgi:hypothetical protein
MFADAPQCYCTYRIHGPNGHPLSPLSFGLHRNYWGNPPGVGVGFQPPPSSDHFGEVALREDVTAEVEKHLGQMPGLRYVEVVQEVMGPLDAEGVGVVETRRWRVDNPALGRQVDEGAEPPRLAR